ncbi:serine--tRNA ligase, partial [Bacillus cereus]|nr:serine--tRNA ligase [Bacillus cereus]
MLDIKWIRSHPDLVQEAARVKGMEFDVNELLRWDEARRAALQEADALRQARNEASARIAACLRDGRRDEAETLKASVREMNETLERLERELGEAEREYRRCMLLVPNLPAADSPVGASDADNVEVRRVGDPPRFDFDPLDHVELGERLGLIDTERGVKVAGSRSYYLRAAGVLLHRAVQQMALDLLADRGFTLLDVPLLVREEALVGTGFFPLGEEQTYALPEDGRWLVGTSEVSLAAYYSGEIVDVSEPIRLAGASSCFRREVGSAGRDVRGLYRVHQFAKVEQVVLTRGDPAESNRML